MRNLQSESVVLDDLKLTESTQKYAGFEFMKPLIAGMVRNDPSKRPTTKEVVERFTSLRRTLSIKT